MHLSKTVLNLLRLEIIETYWNVNGDKKDRNKCLYPEIIETYWNVNDYCIHEKHAQFAEIIETYWNVNMGVPVVSLTPGQK